jgi:hypothetical protein
VASYLSVILARNTERNDRLLAQLAEAAARLAADGVEVALMKGSAVLVAERGAAPGRRLLLDLDLIVRPHQMFTAIAALEDIGYEVTLGSELGSWPGSPSHHLPTVLARARDAGSIDLQCRPKGPASFSDVGWLFAESSEVDLGGAPVHLPSARAQIAYLLLHDQFQDGDYWRGFVDLRHLHDISRLMAGEKPGLFEEIRLLFDEGYPRHAVDTQLLTLQALFGRAAGHDRTRWGLRSRAQLWRRHLQMRHPWLTTPLTALALLSEILDYPAWDRYGGEPHEGRRQEAKRKLRELRRIFRPRSVGKA